MAIVLKCKCGETYQTDEKHFGYSIKCRNCHRIIPIVKTESNSYTYNARPSTTYSESKTIFEDVSIEPKRPFFRNIVIPVAGALALLVGVVLTITSFRRQDNAQSADIVLAQSSPNSILTVSSNIPSTTLPNENQKVSNQSVVQANLSSQTVNVANPQGNVISESLPSQTPTPVTVRYSTGKNLIAPQNTGGRGTLEVSNGTSTDAIAKLVDSETNKTLRLVYIQANSSFTVKNIRVGNYILKFSLGSGYIPETGKFQSSQSFSRFDETLHYGEYRVSGGIEWDNFSVTLNKVAYGNARTSSISQDDFEDK